MNKNNFLPKEPSTIENKKQSCTNRVIIRSSGIYDILVMLPFAIPGVSGLVMTKIQALHNALMLSGSLVDFSPFHLLFVNIMALVSIMWGVLRVRTPSVKYGLYDTAARLAIGSTMLLYLLKYNITEIMWIFLVTEFAWAVLQINGYFLKRDNGLKPANLEG
ncbi:MAG TPA: hypothetical protein ENK21_03505 [Trueperaceae bacterium]|nr:hypothetical protein [Trueperaceae bacterium]